MKTLEVQYTVRYVGEANRTYINDFVDVEEDSTEEEIHQQVLRHFMMCHLTNNVSYIGGFEIL